MSVNGPETRWEQPNFDRDPVHTGVVVVPTAAQHPVVPAGPEENRLRQVQALVWPIALLACIVTGHWLAFILVAMIVGGYTRRRLRELRRQRMTGTPALR